MDLFKMLSDLERMGISNAEVARRLKVSTTRLHRCKTGDAELSYSEGLHFIALHGAAIANIPSTEQNIPSTERG